MASIKITGQKRLVIVSGRAHPALAHDVAEYLQTDVVHTDARTFANGEIYARYDESVRGCDAFVIQSHAAPINEWLMEQLIMVDALKRAGTTDGPKLRDALAATKDFPGVSGVTTIDSGALLSVSKYSAGSYQPGTRYTYSVELAGVRTRPREFKTFNPQADSVRFIAYALNK